MDKFLKVLKIIGLFLLYAVYMCVILVLARHGLNYFYHEHVLNHYEDGDYSINDNLLLTLNYIEPYIVYFNNGDIYYKNSLYDEAIESYKAALEYDNVPEDRRCKARVNISLSIIAKLPEDYDTYENIPDSIDTLQSAADNLLEEECAKEDGDGHDEDAQKLYDEIIEEIERLKQIQEEHHSLRTVRISSLRMARTETEMAEQVSSLSSPSPSRALRRSLMTAPEMMTKRALRTVSP